MEDKIKKPVVNLAFTEEEINGLMNYFIDSNKGVKQFYLLSTKIETAKEAARLAQTEEVAKVNTKTVLKPVK